MQVSYPQTQVFGMCLKPGFGYARELELFLLYGDELDVVLSASLTLWGQVTVESLLLAIGLVSIGVQRQFAAASEMTKR